MVGRNTAKKFELFGRNGERIITKLKLKDFIQAERKKAFEAARLSYYGKNNIVKLCQSSKYFQEDDFKFDTFDDYERELEGE